MGGVVLPVSALKGRMPSIAVFTVVLAEMD